MSIGERDGRPRDAGRPARVVPQPRSYPFLLSEWILEPDVVFRHQMRRPVGTEANGKFPQAPASTTRSP